MRWTDNSMGSNFSMGWSDINQQFAAGQIGMYISGLRRLHQPGSGVQDQPGHLRGHHDPAGRQLQRRRCSAVALWRPSARTPIRGQGRRDEVDRLLLHAAAGRPGPGRPERENPEGEQPAGRRARPAGLQPGAVPDLAQSWIQPYINVPTAQFKPFTDSIFDQTLVRGAVAVDPERLSRARHRRRRPC